MQLMELLLRKIFFYAMYAFFSVGLGIYVEQD